MGSGTELEGSTVADHVQQGTAAMVDTRRKEQQEDDVFFRGIFREACNILLSSKRIFCSIALSLVLPLSLIFLLNGEITRLLFVEVDRADEALVDAHAGGRRAEGRILGRLASEWASLIAFKAAYLVVLLLLSLLATSAVVYTVACVYTAKETTLRRVLTAVPSVWRRLLVTFLWSFAFLIPYNSAAVLILVLCLYPVGPAPSTAGVAVMVVLLTILYIPGQIYISVVWHLASVVSVVEDMYGLAAMHKGRALLKGKAWVACRTFYLFYVSFWLIEFAFSYLAVVHRRSPGPILPMLGYAALFLPLMSLLVLVAMVVQTVIYFVYKSYHHESIDKSSLADLLELYTGEYYVPLEGKQVQLEQRSV